MGQKVKEGAVHYTHFDLIVTIANIGFVVCQNKDMIAVARSLMGVCEWNIYVSAILQYVAQIDGGRNAVWKYLTSIVY